MNYFCFNVTHVQSRLALVKQVSVCSNFERCRELSERVPTSFF